MKIAVIGAGISGLTFAAAIQRFSPEIQVDVYERDQGLTSRPQGYSLGLKGDLGLGFSKPWGCMTTSPKRWSQSRTLSFVINAASICSS
jgi:glycine/D-amino acid oxidase-like deaminating enzyme